MQMDNIPYGMLTGFPAIMLNLLTSAFIHRFWSSVGAVA
jgi:hypothetical protein